MEYRQLGNSGLSISVLSYGAWVTFATQLGEKEATQCMSVAYDNGVNFFDNAEAYEQGKAELLMGKILKKVGWSRDSYIVSSKAFFGMYGDKAKPTQVGTNRKHLTEACHQAIKRLQVDYLDLFFCHRPDPKTPTEEVVWTMTNLIQQGKILYWGTSEWEATRIMEAWGISQQYNLIPPTMEQPQYNMFHRYKVETEYLPLYKRFKLGTTIWSPLASGLLTGKYNNGIPKNSRLNLPGYEWLRKALLEDKSVPSPDGKQHFQNNPTHIKKVEKLAEIAQGLNEELPALALAWAAKNPNVSTVITGASKASQVEKNMKALNVLPKLTPEVLSAIENILVN